MKKTLLVTCAMAALAAAAKTSTPDGWTDDYDAALARAAAEKKLVLADFSGSDWCGWCQRLDEEVFAKNAFRAEATNAYVLLMVDSPQDESLLSEKAKKQNPELVKKYRVAGFPTVLLLDEKGGPKKYLKMLRRGVAEAPDVAKYIKPIEAVLNRYDVDMQKESEAIRERVEREFPEPKGETEEERGKRRRKMAARSGEIFFGEIFAKYEPLYDKAFAEAKAMKVPAKMELKKMELISGQERNFQSMKMAKLQFEMMKKDAAEDADEKKAEKAVK